MNPLSLIPVAILLSALLAGCAGAIGFPLPPNVAMPDQAAPRNVAILLFDGVELIDFAGPYEVFDHAFDGKNSVFRVYTVAESLAPMKTTDSLALTAEYTLANCPKPDVVVVPGGNVRPQLENAKVVAWMKERARDAEIVLSVCNGAFLLGKAGLLDGLTATTFHYLIDDLQKSVPTCTVVRDRRFVDNGKIVTSAGLSSGIDGALHVVDRIAGRGVAQSTALVLEYNWQPDTTYARASLADRHLIRVLGRNGFAIPDDVGWKVLSANGDTARWEKRWEVRTTTLPATGVMKIIDAKLAEGWMREDAAPAGAAASAWRFADEEGKPWSATARLDPLAREAGAYVLTIKLAKM